MENKQFTEYYNRLITYLYNNLECIKPLIQKRGYTLEDFKLEVDKTLNKDNEFLYYVCPFDEITGEYKLSIDRIVEIKQKLEIIYPKTRFIEMLPFRLITTISQNQLINLDLKIWKKYREMPLFNLNVYSQIGLFNLLELFGLFEKDQGLSERQKLFERAFIEEELVLSYSELNQITETMEYNLKQIGLNPVTFKQQFEREKDFEYQLKTGKKIPEEYAMIFGPVVSSKIVSKISKSTKFTGKTLIDFLDEYYDKKPVFSFHLKTNTDSQIKANIQNMICHSDLEQRWTSQKIIQMFSKGLMKYHPECSKFLAHNKTLILYMKPIFNQFQSIYSRFDDLVKVCLEKGINEYDILDIANALTNKKFYNIEMGNEEFASLVAYSGVMLQESFEWYQELYSKMRKRKSSKIPPHHEFYTVALNEKEHTIETEILALDDPMNLLIGELQYATNCCQVKGKTGEPCVEYASDKGAIFCVWLNENGKRFLLAQSLVWVNQNLLCFDNIEQSKLFDTNLSTNRLNGYRSLVKRTYKAVAEDLIRHSKSRIETALLDSTLSEEEKKEIIKHQQIKQVTVGNGRDVFHVANSFMKLKNPLPPADKLYYRDSNSQFLLAGVSFFKPNPAYQDKDIYRHPREIKMLDGASSLLDLRDVYDLSEETRNDGSYITDNSYIYSSYEELANYNKEETQILKGDDWYIMFSETEEAIVVHDILRSRSRFKDEENWQLTEFQDYFNELLKISISSKEEKPIIVKKGIEFLNLIPGIIVISNNPFTIVPSQELINSSFNYDKPIVF